MKTRTRIIIIALALIVVVGSGIWLLFDDPVQPAQQTPQEAHIGPEMKPPARQAREHRPAAPRLAPPEAQQEAAPEPAWQRSPMPEPDPEGKTKIRFFFDIAPRILETKEIKVYYIALTQSQLDEWQAIPPNDRNAITRFMYAHPKSRGVAATDGHQEALLTLEADIKALHLRFGLDFIRGAYPKPTSITSETGGFEVDPLGYGEGLLFIRNTVDRVTVRYPNLGILAGDLIMDGKKLVPKIARPVLRDPDVPTWNISYPGPFHRGKLSGKSFDFAAVPLNKPLALEFRPFDKSFAGAEKFFPTGMSYEVEVPPFKEGEVREDLEYDLPLISGLTFNIEGKDFTNEDWRYEYRIVYQDENEREVEVEKGGYWNSKGGIHTRHSPFFPKGSSFPLRLGGSAIAEMLGEAWTIGAMRYQDRDYRRFLEFLPSYHSRAKIEISWRCKGYKEWKTELNCAEAMRKMVGGERAFSFTPETSLLDAYVRIIDAFTREPIPYATLTLLPVNGQPTPIYSADNNGEVRFYAPTDGKNLRIILAAKGYGGAHRDIVVDGAMSEQALHFQIDGWLEFLVVDEAGKPIKNDHGSMITRLSSGYHDPSSVTSKRIYNGEISARWLGLQEGEAKLIVYAKGYQVAERSYQIERGKKNEITDRIVMKSVTLEERTLDLTDYAKRMQPLIDAIEYPKAIRYVNISGSKQSAYAVDRATRFVNPGREGNFSYLNAKTFTIHGVGAKLKVSVQYDPNSPAYFFGVLGERVLLRDDGGALVLDETKAAKITGRVSGAPRPEILSAHIYDQERVDANRKYKTPMKGGSYDYVVPVNADGSFEFPSVGVGQYLVYISRPGEGRHGGYDLAATQAPVAVVVTGGDARSISITYRAE